MQIKYLQRSSVPKFNTQIVSFYQSKQQGSIVSMHYITISRDLTNIFQSKPRNQMSGSYANLQWYAFKQLEFISVDSIRIYNIIMGLKGQCRVSQTLLHSAYKNMKDPASFYYIFLKICGFP